jgi:hypothetical protein
MEPPLVILPVCVFFGSTLPIGQINTALAPAAARIATAIPDAMIAPDTVILKFILCPVELIR